MDTISDTIKTPENKLIPLRNYSHFSSGLQTPQDIVKTYKKLGYTSCAITDVGTISGCVEFLKAAQKEDMKVILGTELNLTYLPAKVQDKNNERVQKIIILAKNLDGWKDLMKITSRSYDSDMFYNETPRLDFDELKRLWTDNLFAISGHEESSIANAIFKTDIVYQLKNEGDIKDNIIPHVEKTILKKIKEHIEIFGENFFVGIDNSFETPLKKVISEILRECCKKNGIKSVALTDTAFSKSENVKDHRLVTCSRHNTTFKNIDKIKETAKYFNNDGYYIRDFSDIQDKFDESEVLNTYNIFEQCESYSLMGKPKLPKYEWTNGKTETEYLKELCRQGWKRKLIDCGVVKSSQKKQEYLERFTYELSVLEEADLVGYFLIVQDYINWCKKQGILVGPGRGSAGGSLICYLLNITEVDPIKYGLMFERFYNKGRNTKDNIEYPDVDVDFPKFERERVIDYVRQKYGEEKVCQMVTFSTLQGRGSLKAVLRMHEVTSYSEMSKICKKLPDKAEISDKLEESGETSIIRWTLINQPQKLEDYCRIDDNGNLHGEMSEYFAQAIRLEGTIVGRSKHAAGVIISPEVLSESCPMIRDKDGEKIAGLDMKTLAMMGHVKFDFLGLLALDKLMEVNRMLRGELWI